MEIDASLVTAVTLPAGYVSPLSAGSRMVVTRTDTILAGYDLDRLAAGRCEAVVAFPASGARPG
jgi:hypothetical protein